MLPLYPFRVMRDVEAVRDTLASEEPYQMWIPEEDYEDGELTCQTTYSGKLTRRHSLTEIFLDYPNERSVKLRRIDFHSLRQ